MTLLGQKCLGIRYASVTDPRRLRNHDLLTSLDVLTTGTYRRLPSAIKVGPCRVDTKLRLFADWWRKLVATHHPTNASDG